VAEAGEDTGSCGNSNIFVSGSAHNYSNTYWISLGEEEFLDPAKLETEYIVSNNNHDLLFTSKIFLRAFNKYSGESCSDSIEVSIYPIPDLNNVIQDTVLPSGESITLDATLNDVEYYHWMPGDLTGPAITIDPGNNNEFSKKITLTAGNIYGCFSVKTINIEYTTFEESDNETLPVNIWPNPGNGKVNLEIRTDYEEVLELLVLNNEGKVITNTERIQSQPGINYKTMDLSYLARGVYMIFIKSQTKLATKTLIIN